MLTGSHPNGENKGGASSYFTNDVYFASHAFYYLFGYGKTYSQPTLFAGKRAIHLKKWLKNGFKVFFCNAYSGVGNGKLKEQFLGGWHCLQKVDIDMYAAFVGKQNCIFCEVEKNLPQAHGVHGDVGGDCIRNFVAE